MPEDITYLLLEDDDKCEIKYEDLVIEHKLGAGGFKDCYAGKYKGVNTLRNFMLRN